MALDTYTNLQAAIADRIDRDDLTSQIPDFVEIAEARINRWLRVYGLEAITTFQTVSGTAYYALPAGFKEVRHLMVQGDDNRTLIETGADYGHKARPQSDVGKPVFYSILADQFALFPTPDAIYTLELTYTKKPDALSVSNPTNWILDNAPDLLLYASLREAADHIMDDAKVAKYEAAYQGAKAEILQDDKRSRYGAGPLATMPA